MKHAIITGATGGIGGAIVERLLAEGWSVMGLSRRASLVNIESDFYRGMDIDFADAKQCAGVCKSLLNESPEVDAIILAAGVGRFGDLEQFSNDQIESMMRINFTSQAQLIRALLPEMKRRGEGGDLIFIGSDAARQGAKQGSIYCASKFAMRGFAQSLRTECAPSSIRVCTVNPGMTKSRFYDGLNFEPGVQDENYIRAEDIALAVSTVLKLPRGTVVDEVNLSPLKKVINFKKST